MCTVISELEIKKVSLKKTQRGGGHPTHPHCVRVKIYQDIPKIALLIRDTQFPVYTGFPNLSFVNKRNYVNCKNKLTKKNPIFFLYHPVKTAFFVILWVTTLKLKTRQQLLKNLFIFRSSVRIVSIERFILIYLLIYYYYFP